MKHEQSAPAGYRPRFAGTMKLYLVRHKEYGELTVNGVNKYEAVHAAARAWGVRWTAIARECEYIEGTNDEAALHTENAAITAASDSLGSVSLTGYEIVKLVKASRACSEMALSAFESYIVEVIAEAVARRIEKYIFTGTGTNQPGGVKTAGKGASGAYADGTDQITVGKTASLTEENVIALYGLLGDGYERNAVWCMNKATFFSDFFPLMNKSKNNVIEFANGKYYIMGAEVYFTGSLAAHEAYLGDFSYIIGNYSQDITVVRSEHSGLATNSIDYLGACVFDSKPVAGFGAFVHLAKAAA